MALAMFGALAVIVVVPAAKPETGTITLVPPAGKTAVAGTVALLASLEFRVTVKPPAGARPPLRVNDKTPEPAMAITRGDPANAIDGGGTVMVFPTVG